MSTMRHMSIDIERRVDTVMLDSEFRLIHQGSNWRVSCVIGEDEYTLFNEPAQEAEARKVFRYCSAKPASAREAARALYLHGESGLLDDFVERAQSFVPQTRRRSVVTVELEVEMAGDEDSVAAYVRDKMTYAVAIKKVNVVTVRFQP